jgi:hypothetical protein
MKQYMVQRINTNNLHDYNLVAGLESPTVHEFETQFSVRKTCGRSKDSCSKELAKFKIDRNT